DHLVFDCDATTDKGGSNYGHYCNPALDAAEKLQLGTADVSKRKAAFHTIHGIILQDNPVMYLFAPGNVSVYNNRLHNYEPSAIGPSECWNIWDWWVSQ